LELKPRRWLEDGRGWSSHPVDGYTRIGRSGQGEHSATDARVPAGRSAERPSRRSVTQQGRLPHST